MYGLSGGRHLDALAALLAPVAVSAVDVVLAVGSARTFQTLEPVAALAGRGAGLRRKRRGVRPPEDAGNDGLGGG